MLRAILSLSSILFFGTIGILLSSVYYNFSMAQLEISGNRPIAINWDIPRINVVVEYNNYSIAEEASEAVISVVEVEEDGEAIEAIYQSPSIVEIEKTVIEDDVNGGELIDHYGFPVPDAEYIRTINLESYVDSLHLEKILAEFNGGEKSLKKQGNDFVSVEKSSNKKTPPLSKEMIFMDYSKKKRAPPVLKKVKVAHSSLVSNMVIRKSDKNTLSFSPFLALASKFTKTKFFQRSLRVHSAVGGHYLNFQFIPDYDKDEIFYSDEKNRISIFPEKRLREGMLRGSIVSPEHIRVVVNIPILEKEGEDFDIPLIDEETFKKYRSKITDIYGGFLLVQISKKVEDVDVGSDYSFRIFLDEEFREISRENDYSYILFMGIHPGVSILSYLLEDGRVAEKLIHISADEILYEFSPLEKAGYETFELYQRNLFSSERRELPLGEGELNYFNREIFPVKKGLNYYEIKKPPTLRGARNYLKLGHLDGTLHVGYKRNRQLEVPNQDFIESIIDGFNINDLSNFCLVQLNFTDPILHFRANLSSEQKYDNFNLIYLNRDGTFEEMPSLKTDKVFILGESPGVLSGWVDYSNGEGEFFKSFCSVGSYLIEQL